MDGKVERAIIDSWKWNTATRFGGRCHLTLHHARTIIVHSEALEEAFEEAFEYYHINLSSVNSVTIKRLTDRSGTKTLIIGIQPITNSNTRRLRPLSTELKMKPG